MAVSAMLCSLEIFRKADIPPSMSAFMIQVLLTNSKDPEMAFKFISALYSDPTVMNLWQYGIEDVNYQTQRSTDGEDATNYKYHQNTRLDDGQSV